MVVLPSPLLALAQVRRSLATCKGEIGRRQRRDSEPGRGRRDETIRMKSPLAALVAAALTAAAAAAQPPVPEPPQPEQLFISPAGQPFRAKPGEPYPVAQWFAQADKR